MTSAAASRFSRRLFLPDLHPLSNDFPLAVPCLFWRLTSVPHARIWQGHTLEQIEAMNDMLWRSDTNEDGMVDQKELAATLVQVPARPARTSLDHGWQMLMRPLCRVTVRHVPARKRDARGRRLHRR